MASEDLKAIARRAYDEAWNRGDLSVIDQAADPRIVAHDPSLPYDIHGPEGVKELISGYRSAFPDVRMTVEELIAEDDRVVIRWTSQGTHRGELMGLAPTGRAVKVTGISVEHYRDGKAVEMWVNWDTLGMLQQIGALPAPGSLGERVAKGVQRLIARRRRGEGQASA